MSAAVQQSFDDLDEDLATRAAIVGALDETLFVEAGAGSGKTKALVDRIVALVVERDVPMREIAAVTFTEKAAAELRDRIRRALEPVGRDADPVVAARRDVGVGGARRGRGVHAAHVRATHPGRAPGRSGPAAPRAGARRHRVAARLRGTVDPLRRRAARGPRARAHRPPRAQRRHHARGAAHARPRVQRQLGPRRRTDARGARPSPGRRHAPTSARRARRAPGAGRPVPGRRRQARRRTAVAHDLAPGAGGCARRVRATADPQRRRAQGGRHAGTEGQLARRMLRRRGAGAGQGVARPGHRNGPHAGRAGGAAAGVGARTVHAARGRHAARRGRARVPRPARTGAFDAARPRARLGGAAATPRPLHPAPPRRVPGHRPHPMRPRRVAGVRGARRALPPLGRTARRPGTALRGGRPEAVDLPVPPRRHRRVPPRRVPPSARRRATSPATSAPWVR